MRLLSCCIVRVVAACFSAAVAGCLSTPEPFVRDYMYSNQNRTIASRESGKAISEPQRQPSDIVPAAAVEPPLSPAPAFTPDKAVEFALLNNPQLAAFRQQRGVAAGGVVIARTYPFNPMLQSFVWGANGPASAGVTNHVFNEHTVRLDLEVRGQGQHRRDAAGAAVSRTEWEIATQEMAVTIATIRAFNTVLYRKRKLDVLQDTIKFNQNVVEQIQKLVDLGRFRPADLVVAKTELDAARALLGQGRTALAMARADLRRQLGTVDDSFDVRGELDVPFELFGIDEYTRVARELRPDLHARKSAAVEAQARLRLQVADRYGNPSAGPAFEYNETSTTFVGLWLFTPIPVLNTRQGEIMQAQANYARSLAEVHQLEVQAEQDVQAALARLEEARKWSDSYNAEVLPNLKAAVEDLNKLLGQNEPGVDVIRVLGVQRNYLRAFDNSLDALFELSQARADLGAAVADPGLAVGMGASKTKQTAVTPKTSEPPRKIDSPEPKIAPKLKVQP